MKYVALYSIEDAKEYWKVKCGERIICCVPSEREARKVVTVLQRDFDARLHLVV